jgi:hypothetical protein
MEDGGWKVVVPKNKPKPKYKSRGMEDQVSQY